jgi:hypothetical protein
MTERDLREVQRAALLETGGEREQKRSEERERGSDDVRSY